MIAVALRAFRALIVAYCTVYCWLDDRAWDIRCAMNRERPF